MVVDWSAAAAPTTGRDSIWIAARRPDAPAELRNPATRSEAGRWLHERLVSWSGRRVLVGVDASFGYPTGFAVAAGLAEMRDAPWAATWAFLADAITDDARNRNNRFEVAAALNARVGPGPGPFWGCPPARATPHLRSTKAPGFPHRGLEEYRIVERAERARGNRVFSGWQLLGAGSVGSQTLTAVPVLERLRRHPDLAPRTRVWPYEPLDPTAPDAVVFAEVWPGSIPLVADRHPVRDAAQVLGLVDHLAALDRSGGLAGLLAPGAWPAAAAEEEGWILGAPDPTAGPEAVAT